MKKIKIVLESKLFLLICTIISLLVSFLNYNKVLPNVGNEFLITNINNNDKCKIYTKHVLINYYGECDYNIGDVIKVDGDFLIPSNNTNFNLFNYRLYLRSKKIYYVMNNPNIELVGHTKNIFYKIKNGIIKRLNLIGNSYLYTFILGDNSNLDDNTKLSFQHNGISHLFAVSGMHVSLLSLVILNVLNSFKKTNFNYVYIIFFLFFFAFLTNYPPSILRAVVMFILLLLNKKVKIKTIYLYLYMVMAFMIYNPYLIYNVGFLFSFIITFFLIKYGNIKGTYLTKIMHTSFIAFLASIPIMINNFYSINLISPIVNLFFVPFVSLIIFPLSLICFIFPIFNNLLFILTTVLENVSIFIDNFGINLILFKLPLYGFIGYYIIIFLVLERNKKYIYLFLFVIMVHYFSFNIYDSIHFIDVGQGDSILLRYKYNKTILIDTGGNRYYDLSKNILIPYLKSIGIKKIDYLILTHGDYDHMGEVINLVNNFKVEKVIFNCGEYNELESELIRILDKKKIPYYSCINELDIDNSKLYFLQTKEYDNENDNSNVIYTEIDGYKFMFMGDAGVEKERDILDKYNISNIDVLKVGHHGSKTSSSETFINEINPKYSVISVGKNNRYGHPNKEVLNNLEDSKIYRTDEDGSIMFKIKNDKLKIETCSP